jgi:hypothetical protein
MSLDRKTGRLVVPCDKSIVTFDDGLSRQHDIALEVQPSFVARANDDVVFVDEKGDAWLITRDDVRIAQASTAGGRATALAIAPNALAVAIGRDEEVIELRRLPDLRCVTLESTRGTPTAMAFSDDETLLVCGTSAGEYRIYFIDWVLGTLAQC